MTKKKQENTSHKETYKKLSQLNELDKVDVERLKKSISEKKESIGKIILK